MCNTKRKGNLLRWDNSLVILLEHHETSLESEASRRRRFSRLAQRIELNVEQEAGRVQVGTNQANKIELDEETQVRREQVGTLQAIVHKIELNKDKEARREQVVTFQAVLEQNRDDEKKARQDRSTQAKHRGKTWRNPWTQ